MPPVATDRTDASSSSAVAVPSAPPVAKTDGNDGTLPNPVTAAATGTTLGQVNSMRPDGAAAADAEEQHEGRRFKALGGLGGKKAKGGKDSKPKFMIANTDKPSTRRASSLSPRASRSQVWPMGTVLPIVDRVEKHV